MGSKEYGRNPPASYLVPVGMDPNFIPIKQKKQNTKAEKRKAAKEEIDKLVAVGFILEVCYPKRSFNLMFSKKAKRK